MIVSWGDTVLELRARRDALLAAIRRNPDDPKGHGFKHDEIAALEKILGYLAEQFPAESEQGHRLVVERAAHRSL